MSARAERTGVAPNGDVTEPFAEKRTAGIQHHSLSLAHRVMIRLPCSRSHHHREHRVVPTARRVNQPQRVRDDRVMRNHRSLEDNGRVAEVDIEIRIFLSIIRQYHRTVYRSSVKMHHIGIKYNLPVEKVAVVCISKTVNYFNLPCTVDWTSYKRIEIFIRMIKVLIGIESGI